MQKEFLFDFEPESNLWDGMWTTRTIEQELEACDLETPAKDLFLAYIPKGGRVIDGGCGFAKWVIYLKRRGYDIVGIDNNEIAVAKLKDFEGIVKYQERPQEILLTEVASGFEDPFSRVLTR